MARRGITISHPESSPHVGKCLELVDALCQSIAPAGRLVPLGPVFDPPDKECVRFQQRTTGGCFRLRAHLGEYPLNSQVLSRLIQERLPHPIRLLAQDCSSLPSVCWHAFAYFDASGSELLRGAIADEAEAPAGLSPSAAFSGTERYSEAYRTGRSVEIMLRALLPECRADTRSQFFAAPLSIQIIPSSALFYPAERRAITDYGEHAKYASAEVQVMGGALRLTLSITAGTTQVEDRNSKGGRKELMETKLNRDDDHTGQVVQRSLQFSLDLGTLELSLREFLSLRPGSVIHIPNVESSQGLLRYAGRPVAEVDIEIEQDGLNVKVREWLALPAQDPAVSGMAQR